MTPPDRDFYLARALHNYGTDPLWIRRLAKRFGIHYWYRDSAGCGHHIVTLFGRPYFLNYYGV